MNENNTQSTAENDDNLPAKKEMIMLFLCSYPYLQVTWQTGNRNATIQNEKRGCCCPKAKKMLKCCGRERNDSEIVEDQDTCGYLSLSPAGDTRTRHRGSGFISRCRRCFGCETGEDRGFVVDFNITPVNVPQDVSVHEQLKTGEKKISIWLESISRNPRFDWNRWVDASMGLLKGFGQLWHGHMECDKGGAPNEFVKPLAAPNYLLLLNLFKRLLLLKAYREIF